MSSQPGIRPVNLTTDRPVLAKCPYCREIIHFRGRVGEGTSALMQRVATGLRMHLRCSCTAQG